MEGLITQRAAHLRHVLHSETAAARSALVELLAEPMKFQPAGRSQGVRGERPDPYRDASGNCSREPKVGVPNGIRTRVTALKGPCPRPLDDGDETPGAKVTWWSQPGSNRRPLACHASALPAELWPPGANHFQGIPWVLSSFEVSLFTPQVRPAWLGPGPGGRATVPFPIRPGSDRSEVRRYSR